MTRRCARSGAALCRATGAHPLAAGLALVAAGALVWQLAQASTIAVTTTADTVDGNTTSIAALLANPGADGKISLREAITAANNDAASGPHTITLPAGTYSHTAGQMAVTAAITIQGAGQASTIINVTGGSRGFTTSNSLTLTGLTLKNAATTAGSGGCILVSAGSLSIGNSTLNSCQANNGSNNGGAISMSGTSMTLSSVTVSGNSVNAGSGGGLALNSGTTTITGSTFSSNSSSNNSGGAIWVTGSASVSVTDSAFTGNTGGVGGGGVAMASSGTATLTRVTFGANAGSNGLGGGLLVSSGTATVANATFSGNSTNNGGSAIGVNGTGNATLTNVTVASNTTTNGASGLARSAGTLSLTNTIVANNTGGSGNCSGTIVNTGYNLDSGTTCGFGSANHSLSSSNPLLSALASNGGNTQTMALGAGSPAINAGTATGAPTTDQRGASRSGATDIGAYEYGGAVAGSLSLSGTVFEDVNYGGGAGRSLATSGGIGLAGTTLELYDGSGSYVASTTSASNGSYSFGSLSAATYYVRVVGSSVASQRSGSTAALAGVMTYRTDASSGTANAVTDNVGGTNPALVDPGAASSGAAFNTGTFVFSAGLTGTAQSVAPVTLSASSTGGVDFGFNFDTVVNTNDSGQGSLRQAITNANTLGGDSSLAQSGRSAAMENIVFMIANGTAGSGLRSAYNYFTTSAGAYNVATISPASLLPTITSALVMDAQTQPGWSLAPLIELNGTNAGNTITSDGLQPLATGCVIRGFVINRFAGEGIYSNNGNNLVIQGNYIGTNAAGTAVSANARSGVYISVASSGHLIGGTTAAQRNVISGNTREGVALSAITGSSVQGNYIGVGASGSGTLGNVRYGVNIGAGSGNNIGGTAAGAGNVIANNAMTGVIVATGASGITIEGNSIYGNTGQGIDLDGDGVTANHATKTAGQANLDMDYPVFNSAALSGTTLTVSGYVGSAAGQSAFASARVEVFVSDASSANGQGKTYLGYVTTDANGNFSGTITGVSGVTAGTSKVTGTATDGSGNTSEFGPNVVLGYALSGTVFEDLHYGGGAGRSLATSGGTGASGATVELYSSGGVWQSSTTTASGGGYSFSGLAAGSYYVRVVGGSVLSTRSGSSSALAGVMTYRTTAASGSAVAVTDDVGGTNPALIDPGAASSGATFNTTTFVFSAVLSGTAQAVTPVTISSPGAAGMDFGFNFDTVVNTNDSGAGSLRQAIINANTLTGDASLAQSGRAAGVENLVFMISNGTTGSGGSLSLTGGLRSTNNYFSGGIASIAPASALPEVTGMVIDAQAQPGWSAAPLIELNGSGAGASVSGLTARGGTTLRGLIVNRFTGNGVNFYDAGANVLQGCSIGLNSAGTAASANGGAGVNTYNSPNNTIGGTATSAGNVISGNSGIGINLSGTGAGTVIQGNTIGLNAAGTARVANGSIGVLAASGNATIGGTSAAARNVIAGNTYENVQIGSGGSGSTFQGNYIGTNASGATGIANGSDGLWLNGASNVQVGGTAAGAGNVFAGNAGRGVNIGGSGNGNAVLGNSIFGNGNIGIDLGNDGLTANDGAKTSGQPNLKMDYPVFTSATPNGSTLTVTGYVGSAAGQATFASARVEVFVSDASNPNGQGKTYLGYLTTDASGNFNGSITGASGITAGTAKVTGTATDGGNNTSEFGPNLTAGYGLAGTVFEDLNYGGGAGRSLAASGGTGVAGATVELYNSSGSFVTSTTTVSGGGYGFNGLAAGTYYVRVVSGSVLSTRSGSTSAVVGVLTYRTTATSGAAVAQTDYVGGTNPALVDPGAASSGAAFSTSTFVFSAGLAGTAQNVTPATLASSNIVGLDFGFNFDTVVNTNNGGPGSLRQAITNANTLGGDGSLAQSGRTAATENLVFMISNGSTGSGGSLSLTGGLRSSNNYFSGGVATITPASALPTVSASLVIDAQAQPGWSANPVIELNGSSAGSTAGLTLNGGASVLRGLVINRFNGDGLALGAAGNTVAGNWIGVTAAGTAAAANTGHGINIVAGGSNSIGGATAALRNVISGNGVQGIEIASGNGNVIQGNYLGTNAAGTAAVANGVSGIYVHASTGSNTIGGSTAGLGNLVSGNAQSGITLRGGSGSNIIRGNIIGLNAAGNAAIANAAGITLSITGNNNTIGGTGTGDGNTIAGNTGSGVVAFGNATNGNAILGNSLYANGGIGIDLGTATGSAGDGPTPNDGAKTTGQPNLWMDEPVFTSASLAGTTLSVAGYVGSAASQSTFAASRVEVFIADASNPNGQGKTYLGFLTADANGNFSGTITGVSGVTAGSSSITGTATDTGNNTSEFGPNLMVSNLTLTGTVFEDANYGGGAGRNLAGSGGTGVGGATVELYSGAGSYLASATTASSGAYSFSSVQANTSYFVRVVGSTVASTRSGSTAGLVGVMSYRSTASSGSAVDVTDNVGGTNPGLVDPGAASGGATFNTGSFVYSAGLTGTAQAVTPVTLATTSIGGLDFGFNFDTVVNANDSGAGSLRQAITNANALGGDTTLAQSGRAAAIENIVFMLPNGTAGAGLRSAYNAFAAVSGRSAMATVTLASALPSLSTSLVLDAQTQPGWGGSDTYPVIEINAAAAGANNGITISATASPVTLRGFIVNRAGNEGIKTTGTGNGVTIQGCWVGLNAAGTTSSGYGSAKSGISLQGGSNHVVGGTTAAQRNVVGGSVGNDGISATTGSGHSIRGNYIGVGPTGSGSFGIHGSGVLITGASSTSIIGNVIANAANGINLTGASNTVQSNIVGADASNATALGNSGVGILMSSSNNTIGGTSAGQGNVVRASGGAGVAVTGSVTGNGIQGNSIYGNAGIGIDLGNNGATANDGAKTSGQPNLLMDAPVFTSASISGGALTVAGYVGSAPSQSAFASARVEIFVSDLGNPAGQGQTYLGFLTADASGNFSGTIGSVSGIAPGTTRITGTATDTSKNTSEFGTNAVVGVTVSGTVYEDANYGGGAGRGLAAALGNGGSGVAGARVELYDSGGNFVGATTTASGGGYSLPTAASGNYFVRVVGSTVASQRSGSVAALVGVMTWRADASSGSAVAITNNVGGTNPALVDPGAGSSGTVLNTGSFVFSSGLAGTAQAVSPVAVSSSALAGVDFGFNFDTVVNTNNSGPGSLRQAITNANTLTGDSSLAQSGRTAAIENLVFMISNGSAAAGLRSGINYFSGGVASIAPASALPTVTGPLVLDAQTQPGWALAPVIELNGSGAGASVSGLTVNAAGSVVRGWVINRFLGAGLASTSGAGLVIQGNYIGTTASGNVAAGNGGVGLFINSTASGHQVGGTAASQGNVVGGNGSRGITIKGGSGHLVQGNRVGVGADGSTAVSNGNFGVLMQAATSNSTIGGSAAGTANLIRGNSRGVQVDAGASGIAILGNSIYGNNGLGINLGAPGPNLNDGAKTPGQANLLMDTPVFTSATVSGTTLTVAGYVGNAAGETVFANARVEVFISDNAVTGYGEGKTYLGFLTTDASGNFSGTLTGVSGVTNGSTKLTGTATDSAGNTSEFGPDLAVGYAISGTVFEDPNYGGGAGRSLVASGGTGVGGATVEVYDSTGHFVSSTTTSTITASAGTYSFAGLAPGSYALRVVGSSVASQRAGSSTSVLGVTTYLTDASSGTAAAVSDHVGGTNPALADPGAGSSGTVLNPGTGVFSAGLVGTAQSLAPVTLAAANIGGIDFGFNFDTVVNTNDNGPGSLRQAITNANTLAGDSTLAQNGRTAGIENLVFMLPNGSASAGLRSSFNAFSGGVATITPASALPTVSTAMVIDAQTQPGWVLNPIVELRGSAAGSVAGLTLTGGNATVRGLIVDRFGASGITATAGSGYTVQGCWTGLDATGAAAAGNVGAGIAITTTGSGHLIGGTTPAQRNVSSGNTQDGIAVNQGGGDVIVGNYVGTNAAGSGAVPNGRAGINLGGAASGVTVGGPAAGAGNLISGNSGNGVQVATGSAGNSILANAIYANGGIGIDLGADGISANDGAKTSGAANLLMDSPVFASARARGNQLTVAGYIGTAAGQSVFAGSRVEVFLSDSTSSNGSGKTWLGALTADASGNFSGTITLAGSVIPAGSVLTATATDSAGNTSEFGANFAALVVDLVVNSNADGDDANPGDGICQTATANECTLRAALTELNAQAAQSSPPTIVFAIPGCTSGAEPACVITPSSNLPAAARAVSVDASTQTGYAGTPMIEVNGGADLAGTPAGLQLTASGSSARGLRFAGWNTASAAALWIANADNVVVEANWFGLDSSGSASAANANRIGIVLRYSNGSRVGGTTGAQRNVISNSTASGIYLYGGSGASVLGNYVGTDASGNTAAGNAIGIANVAAATVIGGIGSGNSSGAGNLFAGNTTAHVSIDTASGAVANASATVQGNRFGLNASGAVINSANDAVWVGAGVANSVIGGTAAGAGNVITGSLGQGIGVVTGAGTQVAIEGNSIYGNALLGIDLGRDGVSANDGAYNTAAANRGIDFPVITGAGYDPATGALTVTGYVGTGSGQAAFANARVEFFGSDGDASGYGEGAAFLGTLTTDASGHFNGSMTVPSGVSFGVGSPLTGTATDAAGNTSEFGPNYTTTTVGAMSPSRFNAFETGTASGALVGVLQTRVAGAASSVAVIALDATGAALQTGFTGTVTLSWMQASDNSGALDAGNCRSTWIVTGGAGSMSFAAGDAGRHSGTVTPTAVGREWRLRISYTAPSGTTTTSCSTDAFAVRPASLAITAISDTDDATAGTVRALDNLSTTGGRVHRAGRPFSLRAVAQDASGAIATGYDGTPALAVTGCVLPASGCVAGTLNVPALLASSGAIATDTLSYSEVGAIDLQLTDDNFAAIDAADTPLAQRRIQSSVVGVGRFEPDHYALAAANTPQFATQQGSCAQPGQGFTFVGQSFGWTTAPAFTVTAQNATGAATAMWAGALQRLTPAGGIPTPGIAASNAQGLMPTATWGTMTLSDLGNGVARVALAGDQFLFSRDASTPVASFNPLITIAIAVSDTSELGTSGNNPVTSSSALTIGGGTGIGFNQGSTFDYARLKLQNAFGDVRFGVSANVELQKFTARGWLRLAEDNNCVSIPQPAIAFSAGSGAFAGSVCAAPAAAPIVLNQGRGTLVLPHIPGNVQGAAQLTLNIGPVLEGSACAAGVPVQPTSALLAHLLGARGTGSTQDQNPAARLVWGRQHRDYIAQRELF